MCQERLVRDTSWPGAALLGAVVPLSAAVPAAAAGGVCARRAAPLRAHVPIGVALYLSFSLSAISTLHVSYPAYLAARAAKLLPTMAVGAVWLRKRFSNADWAAAALGAAGLALTISSDTGSGARGGGGRSDDGGGGGGGSGAAGAALLVAALLADGVAANAQQALFEQYEGLTAREVATWTMGVASALALAHAAVSGGLPAAAAGLADPAVAVPVAGFAVASFLSNAAVLSLLRDAGAAATSFVSAAAKAGVIALSYASFSEPVPPRQVAGIGLVFAAVIVVTAARPRAPAPVAIAEDAAVGDGGADGAGAGAGAGAAPEPSVAPARASPPPPSPSPAASPASPASDDVPVRAGGGLRRRRPAGAVPLPVGDGDGDSGWAARTPPPASPSGWESPPPVRPPAPSPVAGAPAAGAAVRALGLARSASSRALTAVTESVGLVRPPPAPGGLFPVPVDWRPRAAVTAAARRHPLGAGGGLPVRRSLSLGGGEDEWAAAVEARGTGGGGPDAGAGAAGGAGGDVVAAAAGSAPPMLGQNGHSGPRRTLSDVGAVDRDDAASAAGGGGGRE